MDPHLHAILGCDETTSLMSLSWCNSRGANSTHHCHYTKCNDQEIVPRNVRELTSISSFKCYIRRIDLVSKLTDSKCENCLLCKT